MKSSRRDRGSVSPAVPLARVVARAHDLNHARSYSTIYTRSPSSNTGREAGAGQAWSAPGWQKSRRRMVRAAGVFQAEARASLGRRATRLKLHRLVNGAPVEVRATEQTIGLQRAGHPRLG